MTLNVQIKKLENFEGLDLPQYATEHSAGADLVAAISEPITIQPGDYTLIKTGVAVALPSGVEMQIRPRSGLAFKNGVTVLNSPGTIDADYRGEIGVLLINHGKKPFIVERGMRIAQMVIAKYENATWDIKTELDDTARGGGGFGSTGTGKIANG
jgi:dUTP pyrophosphatase